MKKFIKKFKYLIHYFFGKHKWKFIARTYKGNDMIGHMEDEYIFICSICGKEKIVKVEGEKQ